MKTERIIVNYALLQKTGDESLESKITALAQTGAKNLIITGLFVSGGFEFRAMKRRVLAFKNQFERISFSRPLLSGKKRIRLFAKNLIQNSYFNIEEKTLLVAHGLPLSKNAEFLRLEKELRKLGAKKTKVIALKGRRMAADFFSELLKSGEREKWRELNLVPLFITIGNHVKHDIFGEDAGGESVAQFLQKNGISVRKKITALSEEKWFWEFVNEK